MYLRLGAMHQLGRLEWSNHLNRVIRQDDMKLLGVSTQTLIERASAAGEFQQASELASYYWVEMNIIGQALYTWIDDIVRYGQLLDGTGELWPLQHGLMKGVREFNPSSGDLASAKAAFAMADTEAGLGSIELLRVRWCAVHDFLVVWIQELLTSLAAEFGEDAVLHSVRHAYESIWLPRYAVWDSMTPLERLQLSVEGMRGHLSGSGRRGDVEVLEEEDRYVMVLDPCGSCGVLRRGDPDSSRDPWPVAGNQRPHPWSWSRTGVGWYAMHSPIAMEYLWYERGQPPLRPLEGCDSAGPCRWFIYKDPGATRTVHRNRMGFPG